ncbi:alkaline phosphatase PhoX [Phenylobacterium terrae]|uniref:Alkaline phosphatase PhoX n=1 Tax=Phenylobacterium terrae TaxID=2665495 RepID=A0ABW4N750_9CAUL
MPTTRRGFIAGAAVSAAFAGYALRAGAQAAAPDTYRNEVFGYGPLRKDPNGIFDLPEGFAYRVVSQAGETMDDGLYVPHKADGMACVPLGGSRVALLRNHELKATDINFGPAGVGRRLIDRIDKSKAFDLDADGHPLPGGVTTIVYDVARRRRVSQHLSLTGTAVNCAGGATPWGSWLSCEENIQQAGTGVGKNHGWVFEVPARARGLVEARPLTGLGRFQHEAAAIDPRTGVVYLTEDSFDHLGLFYRFLPNDRRRLEAGGRLQALGLREAPEGCDVRNFKGQPVTWRPGEVKEAVWIDVEGPDNPDGDLRLRGHKAGAAFVGRGEGVFFGHDAVYFTCTSSGPSQNGQILRYVPSPHEGQPGEKDEPGRLHLFVEPADDKVLDFADNLAIAPWGHIYACEDRYSETDRNHLKALTPEGKVYTVGRNVFEGNAELAGVCFSPDGSTCFVNIYWPGITLAITGPWASFRA